jgi:PAS domain S-box-containing protein
VKSNSAKEKSSKSSFSAEEALGRLRWTTVVLFVIVELGGILAVLIHSWSGAFNAGVVLIDILIYTVVVVALFSAAYLYTRGIWRRVYLTEKRLISISRISTDAVFSVDLDFTITGWSRGAELMTGYSEAEALGQSIAIILPDDFLERDEGALEEFVVRGMVDRYRTLRRRKNGDVFHAELSASRLTTAEGELIGFITVMRDITDQVGLEGELRERIDTEQALLNASSELAVLLDSDGKIEAINETGARSLGVGRPIDAIGLKMQDLLPRDIARERVETVVEIIRKGKPGAFKGDFKGRHYDHTVYPVLNEQGDLVRLAVFVKDVTESVEMQERLMASEEKYRELFESSTDGIMLVDSRGVIAQCNQALAEMLGRQTDDIVDRPADDITPPDWRAVDRDVLENQLLKAGRSDVYTKEFFRGDGTRVPVSVRSWAVSEEGSPVGFWTLVSDISERRKYENFIHETIVRMEEAYDRLSEMDRLKTEFVGMVTHELRAPLATIESSLSALRVIETNGSTAERQELREILERGVKRLSQLIEDLLDVTRIESGQLKLDAVPDDICELARKVASAYRPRFAEKGLDLTVEVPNGKCIGLYDPGRIEQVLTNLVDNALKFTSKGGVTIIVDGRPNRIFVSVSDTGRGVEVSEQSQIFEKFYTSQVKGDKRGTGLGLAICKGIVENCGGSIWVESTREEGSRFTFDLPAEEVSPGAARH